MTSNVVPNRRFRRVPVRNENNVAVNRRMRHTLSSRLRAKHSDNVVVEACISQSPTLKLAAELSPKGELAQKDEIYRFWDARKVLFIVDDLNSVCCRRGAVEVSVWCVIS